MTAHEALPPAAPAAVSDKVSFVYINNYKPTRSYGLARQLCIGGLVVVSMMALLLWAALCTPTPPPLSPLAVQSTTRDHTHSLSDEPTGITLIQHTHTTMVAQTRF